MKRFSISKRNLALMSAVLLQLSCVCFFSPSARLQVHAHPYATQPPVGTMGNFAILSGSAVTNTGPTVVTGDLGITPGTAVTGFPPGIVNGTIHDDDAVAVQAQNDMMTAYVSSAGQPCDQDLTGQDLGGRILTSGVYCFTSSAQLTGSLTLDGQGNPASVFIFQIGSTLTTASNASVSLINGAQPCNVFWQVGSSATVGTDTIFTGNVMALTSITFTTGAASVGGLYAHTGALTLDTNTITRSPCASGITATPKIAPTSTPIVASTLTPIVAPTLTPIVAPTLTPIVASTSTPIVAPTSTPIVASTSTPIVASTSTPIVASTSTPIVAPTSTPIVAPTSTPIVAPTPTRLPDLLITRTHLQGGQKITGTLRVTNAKTAGPIVSPNPITVSVIIPIGAKDLQVSGAGWSFTISSTTSPALITATFEGPFPVSAGESLPPITITANWAKDAGPSITYTATVNTPGNIGTNSTATDTIFAEEQQTNPHCANNNHNNSACNHENNPGNNENNPGNNENNPGNNENNPGNNGENSSRNGTPDMPFTGSDPMGMGSSVLRADIYTWSHM